MNVTNHALLKVERNFPEMSKYALGVPAWPNEFWNSVGWVN